MRILVANSQTPFVRGGAEMLADSLIAALREAGHEAELVTMPFKWYPAAGIPAAMLAARLMEVGEWTGGSIDRLIGLKFPAYLIRHPQKVLWLLHQYRGAYDLWGTEIGDLSNAPDGRVARDAIKLADDTLIPECRAIYTISRNISRRLEHFNGIASTPLYHPPPGATRFRQAPAEDFFFCPGRLNPTKRQHLIVEAMRLCREPVRVVFTGADDSPGYATELQTQCAAGGLDGRAIWRGIVDEAEKLELYARCLAVLVPPLDEDYGYVTLEAMLSAKPVVTCSDSGGPLDFVTDAETGFVCEPDGESLAVALDALWRNRDRARALGQAGLSQYHALGLDWAGVIERLLA